MHYLRLIGATATVALLSACAARSSPTTADVDAIRARSPQLTERSTSRVTRPAVAASTPPTSNAHDPRSPTSPVSTPSPTPRPSPTLRGGPIDALRAIDAELDVGTRALATMLVPEATIADDVQELFAGSDPLQYDLQSNDGIRANVFVEHDHGRAVVTLVRWDGEWLIGAVIGLQTGAPLVVVEP